MITIHLDTEKLVVAGHATRPDGVPPGNNIVCAAVSAITLTLIEGLEHIAEEDILSVVGTGYVRIEWHDLGETGKALIDTWFLGILSIQEDYGEIKIV